MAAPRAVRSTWSRRPDRTSGTAARGTSCATTFSTPARSNLTTQSSVPEYRATNSGRSLAARSSRTDCSRFFDYEGLRNRQAGANLTTVAVPSAAERTGNFAEELPATAIYDPSSTLVNGQRTAFPGNIIPRRQAERCRPYRDGRPPLAQSARQSFRQHERGPETDQRQLLRPCGLQFHRSLATVRTILRRRRKFLQPGNHHRPAPDSTTPRRRTRPPDSRALSRPPW